MANTWYVSKYKKRDNAFTILIDELKNLPETLSEEVEIALALDAKDVAESMERGYENYISTYGDMKEIAKGRPPAPRVKVSTAKIGNKEVRANVDFSVGKYTYYYEYGTGPIGAGKFAANNSQNMVKYPASNLPAGYVYGGGPKVIHANTYVGTLNAYLEQPIWYQNMVHKHYDLTRQFDMWMSPMGISFGIPAGRFYYEAVTAYRNQIRDIKAGLDAPTEVNYPNVSGVVKSKGVSRMRYRIYKRLKNNK